jgi:hypothetical protein
MDSRRARRLWRLRKLHQFVDAELTDVPGGDELEVRFFYNGELAYALRFSSRSAAVAAASARRSELEREGWSFHW